MGVVFVGDIVEALTGTAPTAATEGVPLDGAKSYRVVVSASSGATLSGAGTLQAYHYNSSTGWARDPDLDLSISVTATTYRSQVFSDVLVGPPLGRMRYVCSGVTTSDSLPVNVHYELGN